MTSLTVKKYLNFDFINILASFGKHQKREKKVSTHGKSFMHENRGNGRFDKQPRKNR